MDKIDVFCIGTPRVVGDAVGPIVGSMLQLHSFEKDVNIVGTLEEPVTTTRYNKMKQRLRDDAFIIAVDAVTGNSFLDYEIVDGPMKPGSALSTGIDPVGDMSVRIYTGPTIEDMVKADGIKITTIAIKIVQELLALLNTTNKICIYSNIK